MRPATALCALLLLAAPALAKVSEPAPCPEEASSVMGLLAQKGLHEPAHERWNAYGQFTYIKSWKPAFHAPYTNLGGSSNSLLPSAESSFTGTLTAYLGVRLWRGAEAYLVPEIISERPFSALLGLGGAIQNFELQKQGTQTPLLYRSRAYLRQTFEFGGAEVERPSAPMQLGNVTTARRLVVTLGNFSTLDFLDKNSFSGDLRRQFLNMAFLTHAAYDFAADARGYTWGAVAELYFEAWAVRLAHTAPPVDPNQLPLDFHLLTRFGDQLEVEHDHRLFGRPGAVRLLGYRNQERMGRFDDAVAAFVADPPKNAANCTAFHYASTNPHAPDLCWVRRPNVKVGLGLNVEQAVTDDVGLFFRAMYSDGQTEVYSYTSTDRSISLGALAKGSGWGRPADTAGAGYGVGWISAPHADYLARGGVDGFIGDGRLRAAPEMVLDVFYSASVLRWAWLSADYQLIAHPGFNADRGPVHVFGLRAHAEF